MSSLLKRKLSDSESEFEDIDWLFNSESSESNDSNEENNESGMYKPYWHLHLIKCLK